MDEVIFTAHTPKGEQWLGAHERRIPTGEALNFREAAKNAKLKVFEFP